MQPAPPLPAPTRCCCRYCHACATVIGRVYRGHLIRRYVHDWVVAARAALALQRMVRPHLWPKRVSPHYRRSCLHCITLPVSGPWPPSSRLCEAAEPDYGRSTAAAGGRERPCQSRASVALEVAQSTEYASSGVAAQLARPLVPQLHAGEPAAQVRTQA